MTKTLVDTNAAGSCETAVGTRFVAEDAAALTSLKYSEHGLTSVAGIFAAASMVPPWAPLVTHLPSLPSLSGILSRRRQCTVTAAGRLAYSALAVALPLTNFRLRCFSGQSSSTSVTRKANIAARLLLPRLLTISCEPRFAMTRPFTFLEKRAETEKAKGDKRAAGGVERGKRAVASSTYV